MRPLYFIFWLALGFSFRLFFRRTKEVRPSKKRFGRTIFVSNHPSAFLDPLVISRLRKPVVYFMTRSDVFNRFTRPIFWLAHMLPIYRQQDGGNSQEKNKMVFKKATQALARNRNLLIFGEGISKTGEIIDMGVDMAIIQKSGSWYSYNGDKLGQGRDAVKNLLLDNPGMANEIEVKIREKIKEIQSGAAAL